MWSVRLIAGGGVDGCGAVPGREVLAVGAPGDVTDPDQQPSGAGGADAVQVHQAGAGGGEEFFELFVRGLLAGVDPLEVRDEFGSDPATGLAHDVAGTHPGQQSLGLRGGEVLLRPARDQLQQQLVELGDHPRMVIAQ